MRVRDVVVRLAAGRYLELSDEANPISVQVSHKVIHAHIALHSLAVVIV